MIVLLIVITGLMAGVYFTFSVVVMKSFAQLPNAEGARAMNKINDVIVNTAFLPLFFGSTLWYGGLILWSIANWQEHSSMLNIMASAIYIVGMFLVTAFGNVPLNNSLNKALSMEARMDKSRLNSVWQQYLKTWTLLNHVRTISCIFACVLLAVSSIKFLS